MDLRPVLCDLSSVTPRSGPATICAHRPMLLAASLSWSREIPVRTTWTSNGVRAHYMDEELRGNRYNRRKWRYVRWNQENYQIHHGMWDTLRKKRMIHGAINPAASISRETYVIRESPVHTCFDVQDLRTADFMPNQKRWRKMYMPEHVLSKKNMPIICEAPFSQEKRE